MDPQSTGAQGSLLCYVPSYESMIRAEETLDVILPDRFPDAEEILSVSGRAVIKGYERSSGVWTSLASAELWAFFLGDGGESRVLSAEIPIAMKSSLEYGEGAVPCGEVFLLEKDAHIVNSRKLSFSASLQASLTVYSAEHFRDAPPSEDGVVSKNAEQELLIRTAVMDERFSLQDDLALNAGAGFGTAVYQDFTLSVAEFKTIHEKIVVRASAKISAAFLSDGGIPESAEFELPFTRVFELHEADEESVTAVRLLPGKLSLAPVGEEGKRSLSVSLEAEAQIQCCRKTSYRYVEDAYGLNKKLMLNQETLRFPLKLSEEEVEESFLDAIEFPFDPDSIHLFRTTLAPVMAVRNDAGRLIVETALQAEFVYSAEGRIRSLKKVFPIRREQPCEDMEVSVCASIPASRFTLPAMRKSEIEATIRFRIRTEKEIELSLVTGWETGAPEEEDLPSCRLVTPQEDESLFSLAKRTHSSPALIAEANGLDSENPAPGGKLLLIPVIRAK